MTRNTKHAVLGDQEQTQPPCVDRTTGAGLGVLAPDSTNFEARKKRKDASKLQGARATTA